MVHPGRVLRRIVTALVVTLTTGILVSGCATHQKRDTEEGEPLKITFEQSGGIAGLRFDTTLETAGLPPEDAQKLRRMVDDADFFNLPPRIVSPRPQPDRFQYKLKVQESNRQHTVTVSEEALPASLAPLVKWLGEEARRAMREKGK